MKTSQEALKFLQPAFRDLFAAETPDLARFLRLAINVFDPDPGYADLSGCTPKKNPSSIILSSDGTSTIGHCRCVSGSADFTDREPYEAPAQEPRLGPGDQRIADTEKENAEAVEKLVNQLAPPPVDRSKRCMTDGSPEKPREEYEQIDPATGQQKGYVALCPAERAKGFVRPVRRTYLHTKCGVVTTMALALAETYARDPKFYGGTFCAGCRSHFPLNEFVWDGTTEQVGS